MRWLIHGNITPAAVEALNRHGHSGQGVETISNEEIAGADDLLKIANQKQMDLMTTDKTIANRLFETKQKFHRSIVHIQLEGGDVEQDDAVDRLFKRYKAPKPGMLYTVTETRVKVRQLPGI